MIKSTKKLNNSQYGQALKFLVRIMGKFNILLHFFNAKIALFMSLRIIIIYC